MLGGEIRSIISLKDKRLTDDGLFKYIKNKVGVESIMNFNKQQTPEILYGEEDNKDSLIFN